MIRPILIFIHGIRPVDIRCFFCGEFTRDSMLLLDGPAFAFGDPAWYAGRKKIGRGKFRQSDEWTCQECVDHMWELEVVTPTGRCIKDWRS